MEVTLAPDVEAIVDRLVTSGRFASEADALTAAVKLLDDEERALMEMRRMVEEGAEAADRGERHSLDDVAAALRRDHENQFGPQDWSA